MQPPTPQIGEPLSVVPVTRCGAGGTPAAPSPPSIWAVFHLGSTSMRNGSSRYSAAPDLPTAERSALPWRINSEGKMEVLLVRPRQGGHWGLPRDRCWGRRSGQQSIERVALHVAGVSGRLSTQPIGHYRTVRALLDGRKETCEVAVFGLHVWGTLVRWPEDRKVMRRWVLLSEAITLAGETELADLLSSIRSGGDCRIFCA